MGMESDVELIKDGKRLDGRGLYEFRKPLKLEVGVLEDADGSAYIHWGGNKIVAGVYGPKQVLPRHLENPNKAIVRAYYMMGTFSSIEEHGRSAPSRRSLELSMVIGNALENIIRVEELPSTMIDVYMVVLQAEGGTRVAALTAAVAALMNAGIPMRDIAAGVAVGKVAGHVVLDIGKEEDMYGEADMPMAFDREGNLLLLQMDGRMKPEEIRQALDLGWEKVQELFSLQRRAVEAYYKGEIEKKLSL